MLYKLLQIIIFMQQRYEFKNSRGQSLVGILHMPEINAENNTQDGVPVAIFAHGKGSSKDSKKAVRLAEELPKNGIALFRFDFSGCGESDGLFEDTTITRLNDDLKSAFNLVRNLENIDRNGVGIIGSSLGGMVSLLALSEHIPAITAVLVSPATDYKEHHRKLQAQEAMNNEFYIDIWKRDFYDLATTIRCPCLIIHGSIDDICFLSGSEKLIDRLPQGSVLDVIQGEGHFFKKQENFENMIEKTVGWLQERL